MPASSPNPERAVLQLNKRYKRLLREVAQTLAMTIAIFLVLVIFVVQGYKVYGNCMEPNLCTGERLLGNKVVYHFENPKRGDIVVFRYPRDPSCVFIKRIIGLPGETVRICKGAVYVNGSAVDERTYVKLSWHDERAARKIPQGSIFVLGDNRDQSDDSRFWGCLPLANIQAKAWFRYWPLSKIAVLR